MGRQTIVLASVCAGLALAALPAGPALAQTRVVVPIIIKLPPAASPQATRAPSVAVTTRSSSSQPGVTTTQITVRDTTGAIRDSSVAPTGRALERGSGGPSVLVTTRSVSPQPGVTTTQITVRDTTGASRDSSVGSTGRTLERGSGGASVLVTTASGSLQPGVTTTRVMVQDTSGAIRAGDPAPALLHGAAELGRPPLAITSEPPIDVPIVIVFE